MPTANRVLYLLSLALAAGAFLVYLWWGATRDAFLDMGLLPTITVLVLLGLLGAYATRLEADKAARGDRGDRHRDDRGQRSR